MSDSEGKDDDNKSEPSLWTPEEVEKLITNIEVYIKDYLQFRHEDSEAKLKKLEAISRHNRRLVYWMLGFLVFVIISMAALTFLGKVAMLYFS